MPSPSSDVDSENSPQLMVNHIESGKVTAAGWQVTLCDPTWHVISRSGDVITTNCYLADFPIFWSTCLFNFHHLELLSPYLSPFMNLRRQNLNLGPDEWLWVHNIHSSFCTVSMAVNGSNLHSRCDNCNNTVKSFIHGRNQTCLTEKLRTYKYHVA